MLCLGGGSGRGSFLVGLRENGHFPNDSKTFFSIKNQEFPLFSKNKSIAWALKLFSLSFFSQPLLSREWTNHLREEEGKGKKEVVKNKVGTLLTWADFDVCRFL
jgi:hypothetical protein